MKSGKLKKTSTSLLYFMIVASPFLSFMFERTNIHYFTLPIMCILCVMAANGKKKSMVIAAIILALITAIHVLCGAELGKINNHLFGYLLFILLCLFFSDKEKTAGFIEYLKHKKTIILIGIVIVAVVELILLISGTGFVYKYNWGGTFFLGTNTMPHTLAYLMLALLIIELAMCLITGDKKTLIPAPLFLFLIYESGARIALPLAGIVSVAIIDVLFSKKNSLAFVRALKVLAIMVIVFLLFKEKIMESDLVSKIQKREESGNSSAGRLYLWQDLLGRFYSMPEKWLIGFGDDKVYLYSKMNPMVRTSIWAHSDYIQIMIGKGITGLLLYLMAIKNYFKTLVKDNGRLYTYMFIVYFVISSALNGFYNYRDACILIPFFVIINKYLSRK